MVSKIVLWVHPRSVSTAFEIMMAERGDFVTYHEPFGVPYYHGPAGRKRGHQADQQIVETYDEVCARLLETSCTQSVFFKDMAYYVEDTDIVERLSQFQHTFLVRNPRDMLASIVKKWPDVSFDETGYGALLWLFRKVESHSGRLPIVIDADDLCADPAAMIRAYCDAVGIPFLERALTWKPGPRKALMWWDNGSWHETLHQSRGFIRHDERPRNTTPPTLPKHLDGMLLECQGIYDELRSVRLRPIHHESCNTRPNE